ncbi:MAG: glutamyl-tRNA amidotransferase [Leptolyngbya sp. SIOISBB]|nr:glutamyl-tRNA amidotransferase [Leptolyngbya sp. SIOISBB]
MTKTLKLAVNGTLMRGLALNPNLLNVGATFDRETQTESAYRLWNIDDQYPAMIRVAAGGVAIAVEVWHVPLAGLGIVLGQEPPGLAIGKVKLANGEVVLGVIGEPLTVEGHQEITQFGGWRAYQASLS